MMLSFFKNAGVVLSLDEGLIRAEGLGQLPPERAHKIREQIKQQRAEIIRELSKTPPPEPTGMGEESELLWKEALIQADHIDNPDTAFHAERESQLPEQFQKHDPMAAIVQTESIELNSVTPQVKKTDNDTVTLIWKQSESVRDSITQANCPARCKETGKCYGTAWFDCKPGPSRPCTPKKCPWEDRFTKRGRDWR